MGEQCPKCGCDINSLMRDCPKCGFRILEYKLKHQNQILEEANQEWRIQYDKIKKERDDQFRATIEGVRADSSEESLSKVLARLDKQMDYSIELQRLIEHFVHNQDIEQFKEACPYHYELLENYRHWTTQFASNNHLAWSVRRDLKK